MDLLKKNLNCISDSIQKKIIQAVALGDQESTRTEFPTLKINNVYFHSKQDPLKEAERLIQNLKDEEQTLFLFFGAGLGYAVKQALDTKNCIVVWLEYSPSILKQALSIIDFSSYLLSERLKIVLKPIQEEELFSVFKGHSTKLVTFIPHRPSLNWNEKEYIEFKYICEKFFRRKDVNIATLSRFEKIWTINLISNIPELIQFVPVSKLFDIAQELPILICGAGPGLYDSLIDIQRYRDRFLLIAVDTALNILVHANIEPDLIFSVDPQALNSNYLHCYQGKGAIVFDPTSSYHTLRLSKSLEKGFVTSSPFPLIQLLSENCPIEIGSIEYGGSVSTNSASLAELMKAEDTYFVGQDLSFTGGFAHCKGAILEERLNYKESRFFRREKHNYLQLHALPQIKVKSYSGETLITNEKMVIFRRWFEDRAKSRNYINLSDRGVQIEGMNYKSFDVAFKDQPDFIQKKIQLARFSIQQLLNEKKDYFDRESLQKKILFIVQELESFVKLLKKGKMYSEKVYSLIQSNQEKSPEINHLLDKMDKIDEMVSSQKNINQMINISIQRIILTITEGYDVQLTLQEKSNPKLSIAQKSVLLYSGLLEGAFLMKKLMKKTLWRILKK